MRYDKIRNKGSGEKIPLPREDFIYKMLLAKSKKAQSSTIEQIAKLEMVPDVYWRIQDSRFPLPLSSRDQWSQTEEEQYEEGWVSAFANLLNALQDLQGETSDAGYNITEEIEGTPSLVAIQSSNVRDGPASELILYQPKELARFMLTDEEVEELIALEDQDPYWYKTYSREHPMKKRAQDLFHVPQEQVEQAPILREKEAPMMNVDPPLIEQAFHANDLEMGDRLRVIDANGKLYDVSWVDDELFIIQDITLKVEYGQTDTFNSWKQVEEALPKPYEPYRVVIAKGASGMRHLKKAIQMIAQERDPGGRVRKEVIKTLKEQERDPGARVREDVIKTLKNKDDFKKAIRMIRGQEDEFDEEIPKGPEYQGEKEYINKWTLKLQPGIVYGPNNEEAWLDHADTLGDWMLKYNGRVRWGNKDEIEEDIDFFETYGKLPERTVGGF